MEASKWSNRYGRAKSRCEQPVPIEGDQAARLEALIRQVEKTPAEELKSDNAPNLRLQCSVPSMPVESKAGNQVTWNHFLFSPTFR
jgi:hypothetical protein